MDEFENQPADLKVLSPEESLDNEIEIFKDFIQTSEITRESLIQGWQHYRHFAVAKMELHRGGIISSSKLRFMAADMRCRLLAGENVYSSDTNRSAYRAIFIGDTFSTSLAGGELGKLLNGLSGDKLEKAKNFCEKMNNVGFTPGDVGQVIKKLGS